MVVAYVDDKIIILAETDNDQKNTAYILLKKKWA